MNHVKRLRGGTDFVQDILPLFHKTCLYTKIGADVGAAGVQDAAAGV
jgi:hypothetical protein